MQVRGAVDCLKILQQQPQLFLDPQDIFGQEIKDPLWLELIEDAKDDLMIRLSKIAGCILKIVERQLQMYMDFEPSEIEMEKTASAPLHNLQAERIMGLYHNFIIFQ